MRKEREREGVESKEEGRKRERKGNRTRGGSVK